MVLPTILNNFQYVSFIRYSNEKSELNFNIGVHTFCLDTFIWLVGQFCPRTELIYDLLFAMLDRNMKHI